MNNLFNILANPGDEIKAYITPSRKQVLKITKDNIKVSAVRYPSGRIVETRSYMPRNANAVAKLIETLKK